MVPVDVPKVRAPSATVVPEWAPARKSADDVYVEYAMSRSCGTLAASLGKEPDVSTTTLASSAVRLWAVVMNRP